MLASAAAAGLLGAMVLPASASAADAPAGASQVELRTEAERWAVDPVQSSGASLPTTSGRFAATWTSSDPRITVTGGVLATSASEPLTVALTAQLASSDGGSETFDKTFPVTVLPRDDTRYVLGYERTPLDTATYGTKLAHSLHLALGSSSATQYEPLNSNYGILFAKAVATGRLDTLDTRTLREPFLFRLQDGGFGVVATQAVWDGRPDDAAAGKLLVFTSPDLVDWTQLDLLDVGATGTLSAPRAVWDGAASVYRVAWRGSDGTVRHTAVGDLADSSTTGDIVTGDLVTASSPATASDITGAVPSNAVPVIGQEATRLSERFGRIVSTDATVDAKTVAKGAVVDAKAWKARLTYSDGSAEDFPVDWNPADVAALDTSVSGTHTLRGTVRQRSDERPFISAEADPDILKWNGKYLFISTDDAGVGIGARAMYLRSSDTIEGLRTAADHAVASVGAADIAGCFWAPELHEVGGSLYVFFSPCIGQASWTRVQSHVMKLVGDDPTDAADWSTPVAVRQADGSPLRRDAAHPGISLDMTTANIDGRQYVAWSQRYITDSIGDAEIWIATVDPADPTRLTSAPKKLVTSEYGWDTNTSNVAEGPFFVEHDGTVWLTYSGSNIDTTYAVGLLSAPRGADLTDAGVWKKESTPALMSDRSIAELGPGHNSFTTDEDGRLVMVYHAKSRNDSFRDTYLRPVHWAADGRPVLDMTPDEEVRPELRAVTTTVTVTGDGAITAPGRPASPELRATGDSAVAASWVAPADGGTPITAYEVRLVRDGATVQEQRVDATATSATFEGVTRGRYTATVTAVNAVGGSPASSASTALPVGITVLAHYDFSAANGTTVTDSSGAGNDGVLRGTGATFADGALSLPGGGNGSGAAYVELPKGMFDGQDTITVSAWLKNETAAGNYSALFFGSAAAPPSQYWLFNPRHPGGQVKSVITDSRNTSQPWTTERGTTANGVAGPGASDAWALYTTVIRPGSLTLYVNGAKVSTVATTRTVSEFGDDLVAYIGRSSYPDPTWKGKIGDLVVDAAEWDESDVQRAYLQTSGDAAAIDAALGSDAQAIDLGGNEVVDDLSLPAEGAKGSRITWTSSDTAAISPDGTVTRASQDRAVTLTATLALGGRTLERSFALVVVGTDRDLTVRIVPSSPTPASGWYAEPPAVTVDAVATRGTISSVETSTDGGQTWTPYVSPVVIDREGRTDLSARATTTSGARQQSSASISVDTRAPAPTFAVDTTDARATVTLTADDGPVGSGVSRIEWALASGPSAAGATFAEYAGPLDLARTDAAQYVLVRATDVAGNVSEVEARRIEPATGQPGTGGPTLPTGELSAQGVVEQGGVLRATVSGLRPGQQISAVLRSDPLIVAGIPAADANGRTVFEVRVPSDFAVGAHTLEISADGAVLLRLPVTVTARGSLAVTGAEAPLGLALAAAALVVAGALTRLHTSTPRRRKVAG